MKKTIRNFRTVESVRRVAAWKKLMVPLNKLWSNKLDRLAKEEGWGLFNTGTILLIQAIDDPEDGDPYLPGGDAQAYDVVSEQALAGSEMHILALYLDSQKTTQDGVFIPKRLANGVKV